MKKKISLLGLVLILVLSFSGCGRSLMIQQNMIREQLESQSDADFIVQNFSMMARGGFSRTLPICQILNLK